MSKSAPAGSLTRGTIQRLPRRLPRRPIRQVRGGGFVGTVTFPTSQRRLTIRVMIALGADLTASPLTWAWEDITAYVRFEPAIELDVGRADEWSTVSTGHGRLRLDNRDGRFTRRNPTSPYYGLLSMNTPIWVTVDPGTGVVTRMEMFVNEWPNRWPDKSATDCVVTVQCAGVMRRLNQDGSQKPALRRTILADSPVEYWTLEDGSDAIAASSAVGGAPMTLAAGTVTFAATTGPQGSAAELPSFSAGGKLAVSTLRTTSTTAWAIEFVFKSDATATFHTPVRWEIASGTYNRYRFHPAPTSGLVEVLAFTPAGGLDTALSASVVINDGDFHHALVLARQTGADIAYELWLDGVQVDTGTTSSVTMGRISAIQLSPDLETAVLSVGHVAVYESTSVGSRLGTVDGYIGEMAHDRLARLCDEANIPFICRASTSEAMGAQPTDTLLNVLRECETVGQGVLYETGWGLGYLSVAERYNAPVSLALDFHQGHIAELPEPADDDQRVRNHWTVSRLDGSEATVEETSGFMGTGPNGPGVYGDAKTVNVESDDQLGHAASWRVHLGTVDEDRWPRLDINLTRNPGLIDDWLALPWGGRVTTTNPPAEVAPDTIDAVIEGYGEHIDPYLWSAALTTSPFSVYRVFTLDSTDGNLGRLASTTSILAADATSSDTTLRVRSSSPWLTGATSFDIAVAGERMTVTNIGPVTTVDTFTRVTAAGGWGTADSGDAWTVSSGTASQFSTDGSSGLMTHSAPGFCQISLPFTATDDDITVTCTTSSIANYADFSIQLRYTNTSNYYRAVYRFDTNALEIDVRRDGTTGTLGTAVTPASTGGASVGPVKLRFQVVGNTLKAKAWLASFSEPAAWDTTASDATLPTGTGIALSSFDATAAKTFTFDNLVSQTASQLWTVTRSVNGVVKAQSATVGGVATAVKLWQGPVLGL